MMWLGFLTFSSSNQLQSETVKFYIAKTGEYKNFYAIPCKERMHLLKTSMQFTVKLFSVGKIPLHITKKLWQLLKFSTEAQKTELYHYSFMCTLKVQLVGHWPTHKNKEFP